MDLIYTHPVSKWTLPERPPKDFAGGEIWQCGAMEIPGIAKSINTLGYIHCPISVDGLRQLGFSIIALTAKGFQPRIETATAGTGLEVISIPFADREDLNSAKLAQLEKMITSAADKMARAVEQGKKVLSTCWGGINRSSLLTAYIIKDLIKNLDKTSLDPETIAGLTLSPQEIINMLRTQRSERCLNNRLFERIILQGF